jgi:predicted TIM-barrel fold metal-dependent hydrolase
LLGDAAHPMAPRMGQGANMAIQDAGALATSLRDAVVRERPDRFGLFATLTLPDVDGAIAEAHYAFDHLQADGVVLLANVGGRYLGDPAFDRLFAMLDEREAVVFVHPSDLPGPAIDGAPPYAADFLLDTTRAAITLVTSGTLTRYPKLRIILSHGGGFLPYAAYRIATLFHDSSPETGLALLRRFYFDVALSSSPAALPSLCAFADPSHITFGSDSPYAPDAIASWMGGMADAYPFASDVRYAIDRGNAEMLFPRLKLS